MIGRKRRERLGAMSDYQENTGVDMPAERLNKVVAYLEERGNAKISDLAADLRVSESTIRRDLDILVREGRIQRTHGGAIWIRHSSSYEHVYSEKMLIRIDQKRRIGACCAQLVQDGDTLFLDSGTTTFQIAKAIAAKKNLTVFTYDLAIATMVSFDPSTTVVITGGVKREDYNVVVGSLAEDLISRIRVNLLFLSADAIDPEFGVSNTTLPEASIKSKLCASAGKVILAADSSKYGKVAMVKVCGLEQLDCIVTDSDLDPLLYSQMARSVKDFRIV